MDIKIVFGILATLVTIGGYIPYFRDIFAKKTKPHLYTWLVWGLTQGTATVALISGGGQWGAISLMVGTILVAVIFLLCFKYGTKNITKADTFTLIAALLAIIVWWQLDSPILAVLMVSLIDALGYIPTFRKTYIDPSSETITFWICMVATDILALLANSEHNLLTMSYLVTLGFCNSAVVLIILMRKNKLVKV
jgi:hypothetical protein